MWQPNGGSSTAARRFRAVLEHSWDAVALLDADGVILYASPATARILGFCPAELKGRHALDLTHPDELPEHVERLDRLRDEPGLSLHSVHRYRHRDGSWRWLEARATNLLDQSGVEAIVINLHDVTERRRAEEAYRRLTGERDNLLRRLQLQIEVMPLGHVLTDAGFRVTGWNPAAERIFGFTPGEVRGRPFLGLVAEPSRAAVEGALRRLVAGESVTQVARHATRDGRIITCEWHAAPLRAQDGSFAGALALATDVTRLRQSEERREQLARNLQRVLDSTGEGVLGVGPGGACTLVNRSAAAALGYRPEELLGRDLHAAVHPACREAECPLAHPGRDEATGDGFLGRQDGTTFPAEYSVSPIREGEAVTGAVVTFRDVTERRRLEEQFLRSQKLEAVGRLAAGVAHDFNNLLTVITGCGDLLLDRLAEQDPARPLAAAIQDASGRAASLTRQLLALTRRRAVAPQVLDLNAVVRDMEPLLRRSLGEDVDLFTDLAPGPAAVRADRGHLEQVLLNLAVNARDAMPGGGRLFVETQAAAGGGPVVLAVADTGIGMGPEVLAHLFEPFFTTKGERGTGLGLSTVQEVVRQAGGQVEVTSEPGRGSTFRVHLPRAEGEPVPEPPAPAPARGSETLLLVEDDQAVRSLARLVLEGQGYTVLEAAGGAQALALAARHAGPLHALVTDLVMPGLGGREVADRLCGHRPGLPVLYVTGYGDEAAEGGGATGVLQKPFTPASLARSVRELLDGRSG
jgi:PAS domain S-box-containing protein